MSRWFAAAFAAAIIVGLALRASQLTLRPLHNDEGVNALKFRDLVEGNHYKYDPNEFHGPTLPYFTLAAALLSGAHNYNDYSAAMFRAVPVAFGVGLIALLWPLADDLGRKQTLFAALFTAVSPAMAYYSRDYIHEMLLTFFTALTFVAGWRYARTRAVGWAVTAGVALGLMAATKETFVFALAAMGAAIFWARRRADAPQSMPWAGASIAAPIALAVALLFFTSFFANMQGATDAARAYLPWFHRAGGASEHNHPWYFYFERLFYFHPRNRWFWSEGLIGILAVIGFVAAKTPLWRGIGCYTVILTLIYTALPYKTPWCLLGFYHGAILLAGAGAGWVVESARPRWGKEIVLGLLALGCGHLAFQAWRANFGTFQETLVCADPMNPYVYAQTSPDVLRLVDTVEGLARLSPQKYETVVEVMSPESYWPLPWYLRRFTQVGYWDKIPTQPLAPIMIVSRSLDARFDERPGKTHLMAGYFKLRPDVFVELYVSVDLWSRYVASHPAE